MTTSFAQFGYGFINFENTSELYKIVIDTSIAGNTWQIGEPDKQFFSAAHSPPNAIVTDTLNSYPANNLSVFYYKTLGDYEIYSHGCILDFWYKIDCDTLTDYGEVEISYNDGITWENLIKGWSWWMVFDSLNNVVMTQSSTDDTIVFTGKSNGWYKFHSDFTLNSIIYDSIIFRFTFHSASPSSERDGWMIDDIEFQTWWESIDELGDSDLIYPNPVEDQLNIDIKERVNSYEILNLRGHIVKNGDINSSMSTINVSDLPAGLYVFKVYLENSGVKHGKLIKL
jgi:hypothetical protein